MWVQHSTTSCRGQPSLGPTCPSWPAAGRAADAKRYGDSFEATDLEPVLAERGVGRLIVTGAQTDACMRSTLHGAFVRGYDVTLVDDAHTTERPHPVGRAAT